jgi:hypothetical protein
MADRKMQVSIEHEVKRQFSRVFRRTDYPLFKKTADYYFRRAATLRRADIEADDSLKLLIRNIQKRLFIGIGVELLLKALYLRNDFAINKLRDAKALPFPTPLSRASDNDLVDERTYTLNELIDGLPKVGQQFTGFLRGLKIAKVYRNKEGHVVTDHHTFVRSHYADVESALVGIYERGFAEGLSVRFSLAPNERAIWKSRPLTTASRPTRARAARAADAGR